MPFHKPGLSALINDAETDIEASLPGADARLRRSNLNVIARTEAGASLGLYDFLDWAKDQLLPDTAEMEQLEGRADTWGLTRLAATWATGSIDLTGSDDRVLPAAAVLQSATGLQYTTGHEVAIADGVARVAVTASAAGLAGNARAGTGLNLVSPVEGIRSSATVDSNGLTGGTDMESDHALRGRIVARMQQPPHGGAGFDYVAWARQQPGVTRAWVYAGELGMGTVTVRFMMDDTYTDGIPGAADEAAVQAALDIQRPVTADLTVVAPVPTPLDVEISGLSPATQAVREAIEAELKDLIRREARPGATLLISHIREAVSIAAGEHDHVLVSPAANVTHTTGQIAVFGSINWS